MTGPAGYALRVAPRLRLGNRQDRQDRSTHRPWRIEGSRNPEQGGGSPQQAPGQGGQPRRVGAPWWIVLIGFLVVYYVVAAITLNNGPTAVQVPYTYFKTQVKHENIKSITSKENQIEGHFKHSIRYPEGKEGVEASLFKTQRPSFANDNLQGELESQGVKLEAKPPGSSTPFWQEILLFFGPTLLIIGLFVLLARRAASGMGMGGALSGLGRSRARRYEGSEGRTTFADVAGIDDAKEELTEVVDYLKNPDRYRRLGGMVPKGVLLSGPPGTGKTLLARAVAGEANVPFFSVSAAEFIEMIVGVGASRVRDLFEQAKREAPAIIFIDELDAIGRSRGAGAIPGGGHDEREQTLNQILTEMDGFTGNEGVIVLAATNRPEILDSALLRPGRFDRRVVVNPPDQRGRRQILEVHTRSVPLDKDVDLNAIASTTPGMVGADLRNLANEAALLAARRNRDDRGTRGVLGRAREDPARRRAAHPDLTRRNANAPPITSPGTRCSGCSSPAPTRCARSRSSPADVRWA